VSTLAGPVDGRTCSERTNAVKHRQAVRQKLGLQGLKVSFDPRTQPQFWFGTAAPGPNVLIAYRDPMAELAENNRSGTKSSPPVPSGFGAPSNVEIRLELGKSALSPCLVVVKII